MNKIYIVLVLTLLPSFKIKAQNTDKIQSELSEKTISSDMNKRKRGQTADTDILPLNAYAKSLTIRFRNGDTQKFEMSDIESIEFSNDTDTKAFSVFLSKGGSLSTVLPENAAKEIHKLTISGHMDARDFDYIKWHYRSIQSLDIADATIDAYTGEDGTIEEYKSYLADEIPAGAFYYWSSSNKHHFTGMPKDDGMTSLTKVVLPKNLGSIDRKAFADMARLESVVIMEKYPPRVHESSFHRLSRLAKLYVPKGSKARYSSAKGWSEFKEIMELNEYGDPIISNSPLIGTWKTTQIEGWGESVKAAGIDYLQLKADGTYIRVEEKDGETLIGRGTWTSEDDKFTLHKKDGGQTGSSFEYEILELKGGKMKVSMWKITTYMEKVQDSVIRQYLKKQR